MIFKIFTAIIFISELIITLTLINSLIKFDTKINNLNDYCSKIKPKIKDIMVLAKEISNQILELVPIYTEKLKNGFYSFIFSQVKNLLGLYLFKKINTRFLKFKNKKIIKTISSYFKLLKYVV